MSKQWNFGWLRGIAMVLFVGLLTATVACGGDDDDGGDIGLPGDSGSNANGDDESSDGNGAGAKRAVVTIGDETFEADMSTLCLAAFGAVGGVGYTEDGTVEVRIDLPPEDWETSDDDGWDPPRVEVFDERGDGQLLWTADVDIVTRYPGLEGKSQVDSYSLEDGGGSGTATFIELNQYGLFDIGSAEEPEPITGSFEIDCG